MFPSIAFFGSAITRTTAKIREMKMNLEQFLTESALSDMQVKSMYFKPKIPQDKLANAVREYAPGVGMSEVLVLIDETFWGNGKEGMLITNERLILSKKLGGQVINLGNVDDIDIREGHLIVDDSPIAKFGNPEVMPCGALGAMLHEFIEATKNAPRRLPNCAALDASVLNALTTFVARFTEPVYFDAAPPAVRKPGARTPGFQLGGELSQQKRELVRFRGGFGADEECVCLAWLNTGSGTDFFCVTNFGLHSVAPGRPSYFISHDTLRTLTAVEEYQEGRYVGLRLSNGEGLIVSIQNAYVRPYALKLFAGVVEILNAREPARPLADQVVEPALRELRSVEAHHPVRQLTGVKGDDPVAAILKASLAAMEAEFSDEEGAEQGAMAVFLGPFLAVYAEILRPDTLRKLWPRATPATGDMLQLYVVLLGCVYSNALQTLPATFTSGLGETWFGMHGLSLAFRDAVESTCRREGVEFALDEDSAMVFQLLTSNLPRGLNKRNDEFLDRLYAQLGVETPEELMVAMLEKVQIPANVTLGLIERGRGAVQQWWEKLIREAAAGRFD